MSTKKITTILWLAMIIMLFVSACAPAATPEATQPPAVAPEATDPPAAAEPKLICVIVPPVENPFFGAMQEIA
ncbi:MAG: hypothetical protein AB1453_16145, partial [Chloroflexota bacterium]